MDLARGRRRDARPCVRCTWKLRSADWVDTYIRSRTLAYWLLTLFGWGFYFYAQASGEVIFAGVPKSQAGLMWGVVCVGGVAFTHLLRWTFTRRGWLALPPSALLIRVMAATLLIATASYLLTTGMSRVIYATPVPPIMAAFYQKLPLSGQLRNLYIIVFAVHAAWVSIYLAFAMLRRRHQAELRQAQLGKALQAAELRLLKSQLNPHYLFNALNGLRSLIADDPARAREAVTQLSRTLRYTFASNDEDLVSLERELEMVEDYLALESLRLEDRLRIERDVAPEARTVRIPAMLLQSLVENAIKHGIAALKQGGTLRIVAAIEARNLLLEVTNPRPMDAAGTPNEGVGLRNSRERLRLMFGSRASLALDLSRAGQAIATIRLPA
jgi:sensor histidine kinase YesM